MMRFGDARFWDDFTRVDMSSCQIRQFMDPCKSSLFFGGFKNKNRISLIARRWQTTIPQPPTPPTPRTGENPNEVVVLCLCV